MKYGSDFSKNFYVMGCEYIIPNCDDPKLILAACGEMRFEWDKGLESFDEIKEYANRNTQVFRMLNKSVLNTAQREFIDKKIWFFESDTLVEGEKVKEGEENDIYLWVTSTPDSFWPIEKPIVRCDTLLGLTKICKRKDGLPGCTYLSMVQTDCKVNSWF